MDLDLLEDEEYIVEDNWNWDFDCPNFIDFTKLAELDICEPDEEWFNHHHK